MILTLVATKIVVYIILYVQLHIQLLQMSMVGRRNLYVDIQCHLFNWFTSVYYNRYLLSMEPLPLRFCSLNQMEQSRQEEASNEGREEVKRVCEVCKTYMQSMQSIIRHYTHTSTRCRLSPLVCLSHLLIHIHCIHYIYNFV